MMLRRAFVMGASSLFLKGGAMERFGMYGKVLAKPGQRDAMVEILLAASRLLAPLPGRVVITDPLVFESYGMVVNWLVKLVSPLPAQSLIPLLNIAVRVALEGNA